MGQIVLNCGVFGRKVTGPCQRLAGGLQATEVIQCTASLQPRAEPPGRKLGGPSAGRQRRFRLPSLAPQAFTQEFVQTRIVMLNGKPIVQQAAGLAIARVVQGPPYL